MTNPASSSRVWYAAALTAALLLPPATASAAEAPCGIPATKVYDTVAPSVVSISATSIDAFNRAERMTRVSGSGLIVDAAGLVLTNSHVVFGRQIVTVTLDDGSTLPARVVGADPVFDLALIRIPVPPSGELPVATLGNSDDVRVGAEVFALGNPMGLDQTMTRGIISSVDRMLPDIPYSLTEPLIQTDAPVNPGNSGGPLVDSCGRVIGITTAIVPSAENISFAIPSALIREVIPQLVRSGRVIRPWLGVQGRLVTQEMKSVFRLPLVDGMLVEVVEPGSPAEAAGLQGGGLDVMVAGQQYLLGGDIITAINGVAIGKPDAFERALAALKVGSSAKLEIFREGKRIEVSCKLPERPVLPSDIREGAASKETPRNLPLRKYRRWAV